MPRGADEAALVKDLEERRKEYMDAIGALTHAVQQRDAEAIEALFMKKLTAGFGVYNTASTKLDEYQVKAAKDAFEDSLQRSDHLLKLAVGAVVLGALLIVGSSVSLLRAIMGPLDQALAHFAAMAKGHLSTAVAIDRADEMGKLLRSSSPRRRGSNFARVSIALAALGGNYAGSIIPACAGTTCYINAGTTF